jgi:uncharacterized membrane protein
MKPTTSFTEKTLTLQSWKRGALIAAVAAASVSTALAEPRFFLTELPVPSGYESSSPYQINDQGFVVGASSRGSDQQATVWKASTPQVLGKLNHGTYSMANAINSKGVVAGEGDDGDGRPLGWILSGGKLVNFYSNNGGNTHPLVISETGDIGGYFIKGFDSQWRGGIWKIDPKDARKSTLVTLPVLAGGDPTTASAVPWGFNKSMQAAGYCSNSAISQHAVFWNNDAAHTIFDLGVFGSDWTSLANGLNDIGQVVGESHPPFGSRPVLWQDDSAHTAVELPLLPGDNYGSAHLINNQGTIIGYSAYGEPGTWNVGPSRIVVWSGGVPYDIQSLVVQATDGWTINYVASINNVGQMAALATRNGVMKAVVLNPL